jgi:hypothetical protein
MAPPSPHFAGAQVVVGPFAYDRHFVRLLLPSHSSVLHTSPAPSSQAARVPCGFPSTTVHLPNAPSTSHASHCPLQADSQQ